MSAQQTVCNTYNSLKQNNYVKCMLINLRSLNNKLYLRGHFIVALYAPNMDFKNVTFVSRKCHFFTLKYAHYQQEDNLQHHNSTLNVPIRDDLFTPCIGQPPHAKSEIFKPHLAVISRFNVCDRIRGVGG